MVKDLVCGMEVGEKNSLKEIHERKTYFFCSEQCRLSFKRNPKIFVEGGG